MKAGVSFLVVLFMFMVPSLSLAAPAVQLVLDRSEGLVQDSVSLSVRVSDMGTPDSPQKIAGLQDFAVTDGGNRAT
jgi:hypothetical protein